jgi:tRNA_anti-like
MMKRAMALVLLSALPLMAQEKKEVVAISPEAFAKEVKKDWKAASTKYKGKLIEMTAVVDDVARNASGDVFLSLPSKTAGALGVCCFMKDRRAFGRILKGQKVTVRGRFPDLEFGVQILNCDIVKQGPSPALAYSADNFVAEWTKDEKAAEAKWRNKLLAITGEITAVTKDDLTTVVTLKAKLPVECNVTLFEKDLVSKLKKGMKVTIVGEFRDPESKEKGPGLGFAIPVPE